mmetsp:Transcript_16630/g.33756  ORF Transcript_16630/g.33756 Transcript_16630/m.33756 type:complete len:223 (+) Transcript_16630:164-832(+)
MLPVYQAELVPTDFALRLRPPFIACVLNLVVLVVAKFCIRDWWGAVSLIFVVLMGMFVLTGQYRVNASSALFFCVMAVISGVFDVISCVLYFQHSKYKLFDPKATKLALLAQVVFLTSPLALFLAAMVSYAIFADCRDHSQEFLPLRGGAFDYGINWEVAPVNAGSSSAPRPPPAPVPFSGTGQRLDGTTIVRGSAGSQPGDTRPPPAAKAPPATASGGPAA